MSDVGIEVLSRIPDVVDYVLIVLSAVGTILSIVEWFHIKKKKNRSSVAAVIILVVSLVVLYVELFTGRWTRVPDVVGKTYQDACNIISGADLKYNIIPDETNRYVTAQSIPKGRPVKKGTLLELEVRRMGAQIPEQTQNSTEDDLHNTSQNGDSKENKAALEVSFLSRDIELCDNDGKPVQVIGKDITDINVTTARLEQKETKISYEKEYYRVENGKLIFENIEHSADYVLHVGIEGYEDLDMDVDLSGGEDNYSVACDLVKDNSELELPTRFYVADARKSNPMNVEYMSNVQLEVQWLDGGTVYDYTTDDDGKFEYLIWLSGECTAHVRVVNPYGDGVNYDCTVTLRAAKIGEPNNEDIIFLNGDGTCDVVSEADYFSW